MTHGVRGVNDNVWPSAMRDHNGCNSPAGSCREDLEILQVEQL